MHAHKLAGDAIHIPDNGVQNTDLQVVAAPVLCRTKVRREDECYCSQGNVDVNSAGFKMIQKWLCKCLEGKNAFTFVREW